MSSVNIGLHIFYHLLSVPQTLTISQPHCFMYLKAAGFTCHAMLFPLPHFQAPTWALWVQEENSKRNSKVRISHWQDGGCMKDEILNCADSSPGVLSLEVGLIFWLSNLLHLPVAYPESFSVEGLWHMDSHPGRFLPPLIPQSEAVRVAME